MAKTEAFELAGVVYKTKKAVEDRCRDILYGRIGIDHAFLSDLLMRHENAEQKIGCGVARFEVRKEQNFGTRCFWLVRIDGSETDWSFKQCVTKKNRRSKVLSAMRVAIADQIVAFKQKIFDAHGDRTVCAATGALLQWDACHVDHHPTPFLTIAEGWVNGGWESVAIEENVDGSVVAKMTDPEQRSRWQQHHRERAVLRLVTRAVNLGKSRAD